jgi:hypothetical protein
VAFRDDRAERRILPTVQRTLNASTATMRVSDLERRAKIDQILSSVGASLDTPGFAFVVMAVRDGQPRFYPIRLTPDER